MVLAEVLERNESMREKVGKQRVDHPCRMRGVRVISSVGNAPQ